MNTVTPVIEGSEQSISEFKSSTDEPEQTLSLNSTEQKIPADNRPVEPSELTVPQDEQDNVATEQITSKQAKDQTTVNETGSDRDQTLHKLLSKDIKQQADKPDSKIDRQSLELLNEILSD